MIPDAKYINLTIQHPFWYGRRSVRLKVFIINRSGILSTQTFHMIRNHIH